MHIYMHNIHIYIHIHKYKDIMEYYSVQQGINFAASANDSIDYTENTVLKEIKRHRKTNTFTQARSWKESREVVEARMEKGNRMMLIKQLSLYLCKLIASGNECKVCWVQFQDYIYLGLDARAEYKQYH